MVKSTHFFMAVFIKMKVMNIPNIYSEECKYEEKKAEGKKKCVKEIIIIFDSDEVDESDDESIEF